MINNTENVLLCTSTVELLLRTNSRTNLNLTAPFSPILLSKSSMFLIGQFIFDNICASSSKHWSSSSFRAILRSRIYRFTERPLNRLSAPLLPRFHDIMLSFLIELEFLDFGKQNLLYEIRKRVSLRLLEVILVKVQHMKIDSLWIKSFKEVFDPWPYKQIIFRVMPEIFQSEISKILSSYQLESSLNVSTVHWFPKLYIFINSEYLLGCCLYQVQIL